MFFRLSLAPQNSVFWGAQKQAQKSDKYWEPKAVTHSPPTASWLKGCQQAFFRLTTWRCSVTVVSKWWNAENSVFTVTAGIILCYTSSCSGFSILERGQYENACPWLSNSWTQWWSNSLDTFGHIKNMEPHFECWVHFGDSLFGLLYISDSMKESWCWTWVAIADSRIMAGLTWSFTIVYLWIPVDTYLLKFVNASWVH